MVPNNCQGSHSPWGCHKMEKKKKKAGEEPQWETVPSTDS